MQVPNGVPLDGSAGQLAQEAPGLGWAGKLKNHLVTNIFFNRNSHKHSHLGSNE